MARRIITTNVFAELPTKIAASPQITPDTTTRLTDVNIPAAIRLQPGTCLLFYKYTVLRNTFLPDYNTPRTPGRNVSAKNLLLAILAGGIAIQLQPDRAIESNLRIPRIDPTR